MFDTCQQVPWDSQGVIHRWLDITGYNWVTNLNWLYHHLDSPSYPAILHNSSQTFPTWTIEFQLIWLTYPQHPPEKFDHKISHHGMPPTDSWDLGFLQSIGPIPGAVVGRPLWASSSSADWWLPGIGDPNIAIFGDLNGIDMGFTNKKYDVVRKCFGDLMRFYHLKLALSQNDSKNDAPGLVLKGEPTGKARYGGGRDCCRCSQKSL